MSGFSLANRSSLHRFCETFRLGLGRMEGAYPDGTGMGWHFQHARSPQIPWLIIIFALKFAILDSLVWADPSEDHCCRCLHHSKPALPICNVYPNGQTAHIWATILKASRIPSCKQTLLVYLPTLSFLALRVDCTSISRNGSVQLCA